MLENWLPILVFFVFVSGFAVTNLILSWAIGVRKSTPAKLAPYESGMKPIGTARERVSIQFSIVAMLFLLFDVEAIFLFPWAVVYRDLKLFEFPVDLDPYVQSPFDRKIRIRLSDRTVHIYTCSPTAL